MPNKSSNNTNQENRPRRRSTFPLGKLVPNAVTLLAMGLGLTGVRLALDGKFELAILCIVGSGFLDMIDGRLARLLRAESPMGAQLDSLADFMNFGLAPILILYSWGLQSFGRPGWMAMVIFAACCALRLARFNAAIDDPDRPVWTRQFFTGVPSPAAGIMVLAPVWMEYSGIVDLRTVPFLIIGFVVVVSGLMVSRLPTFSGKGISTRVPREMVLPIMVGFAVLAASLFAFPWLSLTVLTSIYILSLPISYRVHRHMRQREETNAIQ